MFESVDIMQYSDWFHVVLEGELISTMYLIFQKLCFKLGHPEININTLSHLLLQQHANRASRKIQDITVILNSNIVFKKLFPNHDTCRKSIPFYSGYGNLETAYCLKDLIETLLK
uniref:Uncharacterized protein n=1 Tax=Strongyloides papillosus TaxID=174720 RepID=A0A0N5CE39_STREA